MADLSSKNHPKPFLSKLFTMVDEPDTNHIIGWTSAGDALIIHEVKHAHVVAD